MAKEIVWNVLIDGMQYRITCENTGNKYIIHCDDDFVKNIYREGAGFSADHPEEPLTIHGKDCLFVVWDGKPDLVVDGMMLGRSIDYQKALTKRIKDFGLCYRIIFCCGAALLTLGVLLLVFGSEQMHDAHTFLIAGVFCTIYSYLRIRRLTPKADKRIIAEE